MVTDVKDKIQKLLALSESDNEAEAKSALEMALKLMAKHKLSRAEFKDKADRGRVLQSLVWEESYSCSAQRDKWMHSLSQLVAKYYCCGCLARRGNYKSRTYNFTFFGFEEDLDICTMVFRYACDCIKSHNKKVKAELKKSGYTAKEIGYICDDFSFGFVDGLKSSYEEQVEENQEWGLVLVTPKEVSDVVSRNSKGLITFSHSVSRTSSAYAEGYEEGKQFNPNKRIKEACDE